MECLVCHHLMTEGSITLDLRVDKELVIIEDVPSIVCQNCGEQVFTAEVTRRIQETVKKRQATTRTITVPVFSLEETSAPD